MIKFGIIGCGRISHRFMQGIKQVESAEVTAAWSRRASSSLAFAVESAFVLGAGKILLSVSYK